MKARSILLSLLILGGWGSVLAQKVFDLKSPNSKLVTTISVGNSIEYSIQHNGDDILAPSPLSMELMNGRYFGVKAKLQGHKEIAVNETIDAIVYKKDKVSNKYTELKLNFKDGYDLVFRAYDDGVAYRFISKIKGELLVKNEKVVYNFVDNPKAFVPYVQLKRNSLEEQMYTSFENTYEYINLSQWDKERLAFSPLVVEASNGKKVGILEADLIDYPGMFLYNGDASSSIVGQFAAYPKVTQQGGHNMLQDEVQSREAYIAKYADGRVSFPWRVIVVSEKDADLVNSDMIYKLASARAKNIDYSWVKPGKVAWDWWNAWNVYDVDFDSGINNETYKYYIDFASSNNIEYVILDEGWAVNLQADMFQVVPEIDLKELISYGKERNVGVILWAGYYAFAKDIEQVCKHYSEMGVKGFKVDFMDRDDQVMVNFHYKAAEIASQYKLMLNYHGTYKPTGLHRTFPNVINYEGVHGLEQMKWAESTVDQVTYDVTFPFIRMLAGPVDYTQGAMRNATRDNFRAVNSEAMSQGTRCRQLAEYIIFESPLNMLCDNPSNYMQEAECTEFISSIPTTWDETIALNGEISKFVTIARRKADVWYVGALTNWDQRSLSLDLSFLGEGNFEAIIFKDGVNANKVAKDYKKETIDIPSSKKINLSMASGGGYIMKIYKK